jgi:hypothetical protein
VSLPEVHQSDIQVSACDISDKKFLQGDMPATDKIAFLEDVTKPFSDEPLGTFDLIRLTCTDITRMEMALQNLCKLLSE